MKDKSLKFILRYINIIILITLMIMVLNYAVLVCFIRYSSYVKEPTKIIKNIAEELKKNNNHLSWRTSKVIKNNKMWVQLVNPKGEVIYSNNKPKDIKNYYSIKDITVFSKSYLNDYPVFMWESKDNIVILGYPKNSIEKYNWFVPAAISRNSKLTTLLFIIIFNIIIVVIISICLVKVLNKPLYKLVNGIFLLKEEKSVCLDEKGIYKDLAGSINYISRIIIDKNNKIKLRNNAIQSWIASISHDSRTPLSMILGYSAMMEEDDNLEEVVHGQVKIIMENSIRLKELITNLNLATSLQYNMQPLRLSNIRLSNIVRQSMATCINSGILQNCTSDIIIEDEKTSVIVDKNLIIRAIINLITNSAKHNKKGCNITVTVPETINHSNYAYIIISDNGIGISKDKIDEINKEEYCYNSKNQKYGLGLIIVKSIIQAHKGIFLIENGKDKGVTSILQIPKINLT